GGGGGGGWGGGGGGGGGGAGGGGEGGNEGKITRLRQAVDQAPGDTGKRESLAKMHNLEGISQLKGGKAEGAVSHFRQALGVLNEPPPLSDKLRTAAMARFGLALAQLQTGKTTDGLLTLELLVAARPDFIPARRLLAEQLLAGGAKAQERGLGVLAHLAADGAGESASASPTTAPDSTWAARRGLVTASNRALALAEGGDPKQGAALLDRAYKMFGGIPGPTPQELSQSLYTLAWLQQQSDAGRAAVETWVALYRANPAYKTENGTTAAQLAAGAWYAAALEDLKPGTPGPAARALQALQNAEAVEKANSPDIRQAMARAYQILGNHDVAARLLSSGTTPPVEVPPGVVWP
ncbi:MAG: hypothetical protein OEW12_06450, partial [Deltaproteobacteria bacterium]|nr:hypothetical protein [Deltaproteobacteria bacterium]